jgi:hypothetical protein
VLVTEVLLEDVAVEVKLVVAVVLTDDVADVVTVVETLVVAVVISQLEYVPSRDAASAKFNVVAD